MKTSKDKYENNGKQIKIYAVPDNCNQGPFVHEASHKQPEIKDIKNNLNL